MTPLATLASIAQERGLVGGPFGSSLVSSDYEDVGIPVIRGANMSAGKYIGGEFVYVSHHKFQRDLARNTASSGDLVFTQRGTLGQVALVPPEGQTYIVSQSQMRLRVHPAMADAEYVYYACTTDSFRKQTLDNAITTGVPHTNLGILGRLEIPLPELSVQRAIAQVLGALDNKIGANAQLAATANQLAQAIFEESHRHTKENLTLGELAARGIIALGDGYRTKKAEHADHGFRIIRAGDVNDGGLAYGHDFVANEYAGRMGPKAARPGDIILTTKGTVGRVAVVPQTIDRAVYSPQLCYFRLLDRGHLDWGYLAGWFHSRDLQRQADLRAYKSDMAPYVNLEDIRSMRVPFPAIGEQRAVGERVAVLLGVAESAREESVRLVRIRDALLPDLIAGNLRVRYAGGAERGRLEWTSGAGDHSVGTPNG